MTVLLDTHIGSEFPTVVFKQPYLLPDEWDGNGRTIVGTGLYSTFQPKKDIDPELSLCYAIVLQAIKDSHTGTRQPCSGGEHHRGFCAKEFVQHIREYATTLGEGDALGIALEIMRASNGTR